MNSYDQHRKRGWTFQGCRQAYPVAPLLWPVDERRHFEDTYDEYQAWVMEKQCMKTRLQAEDIGNMAVMLSSPLASMVCGQNIWGDGGLWIAAARIRRGDRKRGLKASTWRSAVSCQA